ncbi:hypothetical protein Dsin_003027 [Dipteronia sinensis]|uniref:Uncharacterized protein n=1 Tax=Dipteronia sinensis TaxID=43782 RepID=A0AAE0B6U5_9ROSI|nr:hypothetical protein Dsin_003027 [Dipteronia sinensis]
MAPIAVVFLLPATLIMEKNVVGITLALAREDIKIIWYLLFNSALAYFVSLTNFLVTKHTSALTLQSKKGFLVGIFHTQLESTHSPKSQIAHFFFKANTKHVGNASLNCLPSTLISDQN